MCWWRERRGLLLGSLKDFLDIILILSKYYNDTKTEIRIRILLGCGFLHAMRRHKAWRARSNAQQSCVPATAIEQIGVEVKIKQKRMGNINRKLILNLS